jgi:hypothetical protein
LAPVTSAVLPASFMMSLQGQMLSWFLQRSLLDRKEQLS